MHKSTITSKDGFIGPFARTLKFGDKQDFIFKKQQGALLDVIFVTTEPSLGSQDRKQKTKVLSVREIMAEINSKMPALEMKELKNKNKEDLEQIATGLGIRLQFEYDEIKDRG